MKERILTCFGSGSIALVDPSGSRHRLKLTTILTNQSQPQPINYFKWSAGSPGLVVMGRDSRPRGHGFKSQYQILDGHFSHILL